jgi:GNAT superfamily N-acetyltransferase
LSLEIAHVQPDAVEEFAAQTEREALKTFYDFRVVWHEERHDFAALDGGRMVGVVQIRVAASLAHVERIVVLPERRLEGIGRALLEAASESANYYNCHKMSVLAPHRSAAQQFFERCGYKEEAVLPQHTFKLDIAVLRKFLL